MQIAESLSSSVTLYATNEQYQYDPNTGLRHNRPKLSHRTSGEYTCKRAQGGVGCCSTPTENIFFRTKLWPNTILMHYKFMSVFLLLSYRFSEVCMFFIQ